MNVKEEIIKLLTKDERVKDTFLEFLEVSGYFTAPASVRRHNSFEGGLALHSFNVYNILKDFNDKYSLGLSENFIIITSLLHDLCKVGCYKPNRLKSGDVSTSKPYKYNDEFPFGHGEKSVVMIQHFIDLTPEEAMAIRYHIGPFTFETIERWNRLADQLKTTPFWLHVNALYHADSFATKLMEDGGFQYKYYKTEMFK
jgi:hypothetical protein